MRHRRFTMFITALFTVALSALILVPYLDGTPVAGSGGPAPIPSGRGVTASVTATAPRAVAPSPISATTGGSGVPAPLPQGRGPAPSGHDMPAPAPIGRQSPGTGTSASQCHGPGDGAIDQNGQSVDEWRPGLRKACGFLGYENGDNPMPPGTPFPPPRPFRAIDPMETVFGFKVFYIGAGTATPCDDLRIIFHQGDGVGGRNVRFHSMQYAIAHCDAAGNYLGYTDVAAFADTGGVIDTVTDTGIRPMKLAPTLADVQQFLVFEVWYVKLNIFGPVDGTTNPVVVTQPGIDINNVSAYFTPGDFTTVHFTCSVPGLNQTGVPGDPGCQYDGAVRGIQHPSVSIHNTGGIADFFTDLNGHPVSDAFAAANPTLVVHQHVFNGAPLDRTTCKADGGSGDPPNCYPEFVRGPNSPGGNKATTMYESPGPATYAVPGLRFPD